MRATVKLLLWGLACARRGVSALRGVARRLRPKRRFESDWLSRMAAAGEIPAQAEAEIRLLARQWRDSFCGACGASPEHPQGRCERCWARLARLMNPPTGENSITPVEGRPKLR